MKIKTRLTLGQPQDIQSMKRYIGWGFLSYVLLLIVLAVGAHFVFPNADRHSMTTAITVATILGVASLVCEMFDRRNKRPMFFQEYRRLLWGLLWTTSLFQFVVAFPEVLATFNINFRDPGAIGALFAGLGLGLLYNAVVVWLFVRIAVVSYWKKHQKQSKKAG